MGRARERLPSTVLDRVRLAAFVFALFTCVGPMAQVDGSLRDEQRIAAISGGVVLIALVVATYVLKRLPPLEPLLAGPLIMCLSLGLKDSLVVIATTLGFTISHALYGSHRAAILRGLLIIPVPAFAVTFTLSSGREIDPTSGVVLGQIPLPILLAVIMRTLKTSLESQEEAGAREALIASTGRELIGLTDLTQVREVVRRTADRLCRITPGLVVISGYVRGGELRAAAAFGLPDERTGQLLPMGLTRVAGRRLDMVPAHPSDVPLLSAALGVERHWWVMGLAREEAVERDDVMLVGLGEAPPADTLTLLSTLGTQLSLAERSCRAHADLAHLAHHDDLTGLPNRALLFARMDEALAGQGGAALMIIDLDGFKAINDTRGHAAGDAVLVEVALRLQAALRGEGLAARLGGDEFAVLMAGGTAETASALAGRLWGSLSSPMELGSAAEVGPEALVTVGASVGVALATSTTDAGDLVGRADLAMYAAKATGGGVEVFSPTRHAPTRHARHVQESQASSGR